MDKKFSDSITEFCEMWWEWMKHDGLARNKKEEISTRKKSVEKCEELIQKKYIIIEQLNNRIYE